MKRIGEEQKMTVKEVADVLGYEKDYLRKKVKELFPDSVQNGKETVLNENQVFILKNKLVPRTLDMKVQGENAVTEIEKQQTIILAMQYLQENLVAMKERAIKAERKNAILMHVTKTYTAGEIAKELGMRSAQELNQALADKGIQYKQNGTWLPTADNSSCGYFEIKQQELESGKVIYDRKITQTGREFILSLFERR
jgi:phage antirepressor YoqD-like protein